MPQMSPYNWLMLFLLFNLIMMFYTSFNNFIKMPKLMNYPLNKKIKNFYWKW